MALEQLVDVLTAQGKVGDDALKMTRQIAIATSRHSEENQHKQTERWRCEETKRILERTHIYTGSAN